MSARHLITGQAGEDLAAAFLTAKGLRVVKKNFRCRAGEIDLICRAGEFLVFVEVKTRSGTLLERRAGRESLQGRAYDPGRVCVPDA